LRFERDDGVSSSIVALQLPVVSPVSRVRPRDPRRSTSRRQSRSYCRRRRRTVLQTRCRPIISRRRQLVYVGVNSPSPAQAVLGVAADVPLFTRGAFYSPGRARLKGRAPGLPNTASPNLFVRSCERASPHRVRTVVVPFAGASLSRLASDVLLERAPAQKLSVIRRLKRFAPPRWS